MSFSTFTIPSSTTIVPVDTRTTNRKVIQLPVASTNQGRILIFKDFYGTTSNSTFTISTIGLDLIDDFNSRYTFSNAFGGMEFLSDGIRSWRTVSLYTGGLTPAAVGGFQPTQIPGLTGWYDGSDSATITVTGTQVTQWLDKSGSNNTITPLPGNSNATLQPAYQNGRSVLNFSGNNLYRAVTGSGRYPSDVYLVIQLKSISRYDVVAIGELGGDSFNSLTLGEFATARWHNGSSGFSRTPNCVSPVDETSTSFLLMEWSLANNNFLIRRNGTQLVQTASYTYSLSGNSCFQIGYRHTDRSSSDVPLNAYIAEILCYNTQLNTSNQVLVQDYLTSKWGI
jgi:hypothetical protein